MDSVMCTCSAVAGSMRQMHSVCGAVGAVLYRFRLYKQDRSRNFMLPKSEGKLQYSCLHKNILSGPGWDDLAIGYMLRTTDFIPPDLCFFLLIWNNECSCGPIYFRIKGNWRKERPQPFWFAKLWYQPFSSLHPAWWLSFLACSLQWKIKRVRPANQHWGMDGGLQHWWRSCYRKNKLHVDRNAGRTTTLFSSAGWVQHSQFTQNKELLKAAAMVHFNREITQKLCLMSIYLLLQPWHQHRKDQVWLKGIIQVKTAQQPSVAHLLPPPHCCEATHIWEGDLLQWLFSEISV